MASLHSLRCIEEERVAEERAREAARHAAIRAQREAEARAREAAAEAALAAAEARRAADADAARRDEERRRIAEIEAQARGHVAAQLEAAARAVAIEPPTLAPAPRVNRFMLAAVLTLTAVIGGVTWYGIQLAGKNERLQQDLARNRAAVNAGDGDRAAMDQKLSDLQLRLAAMQDELMRQKNTPVPVLKPTVVPTKPTGHGPRGGTKPTTTPQSDGKGPVIHLDEKCKNAALC